MKLRRTADEIKYDGDVQVNSMDFAKYSVSLDNRPVMDVLVHNTTGVIGITQPSDSTTYQATTGTAKHVQTIVEDADGAPVGVTTRIDERTVYSYVLPRLHVLIARLYVPMS